MCEEPLQVVTIDRKTGRQWLKHDLSQTKKSLAPLSSFIASLPLFSLHRGQAGLEAAVREFTSTATGVTDVSFYISSFFEVIVQFVVKEGRGINASSVLWCIVPKQLMLLTI